MGMSIDFIELFNSYNHAYGAHASICLCTHSLQKIWEVNTMAFVCARTYAWLCIPPYARLVCQVPRLSPFLCLSICQSIKFYNLQHNASLSK